MLIGDSTPYAQGVGAGLMFTGRNDTGASEYFRAGIWSEKTNGTSGDSSSDLVFGTRPNGGAVTERLRVAYNGFIGVGAGFVPSAFLDMRPGPGVDARVQIKQADSGLASWFGTPAWDNDSFRLLVGADYPLIYNSTAKFLSLNVRAGGVAVLDLQSNASAVNKFSVNNAGTGGAPTITATGTDSDIDIKLVPKGGGTLNIAGVPAHADDAAAGLAGLAAGDLYKTSTGALRIKL